MLPRRNFAARRTTDAITGLLTLADCASPPPPPPPPPGMWVNGPSFPPGYPPPPPPPPPIAMEPPEPEPDTPPESETPQPDQPSAPTLTREENALAGRVVALCLLDWGIYSWLGARYVARACLEDAVKEGAMEVTKNYVCGNPAVLGKLEYVSPGLRTAVEAMLGCE